MSISSQKNFFFFGFSMPECFVFKCEKIKKYQDLTCRLKYEKYTFFCIEFSDDKLSFLFRIVVLYCSTKIADAPLPFRDLPAETNLNGCWLQKFMFPARARADLLISGCRLKAPVQRPANWGGNATRKEQLYFPSWRPQFLSNHTKNWAS